MEEKKLSTAIAESLKKEYPIIFKRWIARELESKRMSLRQAQEKYSLPEDEGTIYRWIERYGLGKELSLATMTPKEKQEKAALEKRIVELEKALELSKLKIVAIDTMIDIAEEQFKISIRKKFGPKQ